MFRVAYRSVLDSGVGDAEIESIAQKSAARNAAAGLTGVWLLSGRRCLAALEGDPRQVREIIEDVWDDPRHEGFRLLHMGPCDLAKFDWPFRLIRLDAPDGEAETGDHRGIAWLRTLEGAEAFAPPEPSEDAAPDTPEDAPDALGED